MTGKAKKPQRTEIEDYDTRETGDSIDQDQPLSFEDLGLEVPPVPPTQVVSIRLPSRLLNEIRAYASERDIPYRAATKLFSSEGIKRRGGKAA